MVDKLSVICGWVAAMYPLATSTVATCFDSVHIVVTSPQQIQDVIGITDELFGITCKVISAHDVFRYVTLDWHALWSRMTTCR